MSTQRKAGSRRVPWRRLILLGSLCVNVLLATAVLYLKVPAVHAALFPAWHVIRTGLSDLLSAPGDRPVEGWLPRITPTRNLASNELDLAFREDRSSVRVTLPLHPEAGVRYIVRLDDLPELEVAAADPSFVWPLHGGGIANSATIWEQSQVGEASPLGEIEIWRATEEESLLETGTRSPGGSVVVGRCTFDIIAALPEAYIAEERVVLSSLTASERSRIRMLFPELTREPALDYKTPEELVRKLGRLLHELCERGLLNLSAKDNARLDAVPPSQALVELARKDFGVQCLGLRSVFEFVAISCGWLSADQIREVDAFRFGPVPYLTDNTHALLDVRVPGGGWVLFDPTALAVLKDDAGRYLSSEDVFWYRKQGMVDRILVERVSDPCGSGYLSGPLGFSDRDLANYNYWSHFAHLTLRTVSLPQEGMVTESPGAD